MVSHYASTQAMVVAMWVAMSGGNMVARDKVAHDVVTCDEAAHDPTGDG